MVRPTLLVIRIIFHSKSGRLTFKTPSYHFLYFKSLHWKYAVVGCVKRTPNGLKYMWKLQHLLFQWRRIASLDLRVRRIRPSHEFAILRRASTWKLFWIAVLPNGSILLSKTSDLANGASAVHFVMNAFYKTVIYLAASSRLFLMQTRFFPRNWANRALHTNLVRRRKLAIFLKRL